MPLSKKNKPALDYWKQVAHELKVIVHNTDDLKFAKLLEPQVSKQCKLFLQAEWSHFEIMTPKIVAFIHTHTVWRASLQSHKFMHIP